MTAHGAFDIFLVAAPGHEAALGEEARACRFARVRVVPGGVTIKGTWPEVWRANLELRGASRVLARIGAFRASHLTQLEAQARQVPWASVLRADQPFRVEVTCQQSRIYHSGAATERIGRAIVSTLAAAMSPDAEVCVKARIENDFCTLALDTSGEPLHKRGFKEAIAKAPMRETMAALFLRQCGYDGSEPVLDPMCGSGTFVIEAAEIAAGLKPGRARHFAFERLATFREASWAKIRARSEGRVPGSMFYGRDRDSGAIRMSRENAERAGVAAYASFAQGDIGDLVAPVGPPGLVIVNPPYGARVGDKRALKSLYTTLGDVLTSRFAGWRVGIVTSDGTLARASGLPFRSDVAYVLHGGLRVALYQTPPLP